MSTIWGSNWVRQRDGGRDAEQLTLRVGEDLMANRCVALHLLALLGFPVDKS